MVGKEKFLEFITLVEVLKRQFQRQKIVQMFIENSELHSYTITNWEEFYDYYSFIPGQK